MGKKKCLYVEFRAPNKKKKYVDEEVDLEMVGWAQSFYHYQLSSIAAVKASHSHRLNNKEREALPALSLAALLLRTFTSDCGFPNPNDRPACQHDHQRISASPLSRIGK